jgi:polar amino acid transport system permease protein
MGMNAGGGSSLAARAVNQQLASDIAVSRQKRSRRWRLQFSLMWVGIIVALISALVLTVGINSEFIQTWTPFILLGVPVTLFVAVVSIFFAVCLAVLGALGRMSRNPYVNATASFYVSFFRGTPLILQILFVFLALPQAGIVLDPLPTAILALSLNYGAYLTEVFRSGIEAVPHGQTEAAESLGMSERLAFRRIVVPQAFRIVTPAIGNDFIAMLKDSALASVVGVQELLWRAQAAGRPSFQSMQTLFVAALVYWVLTISFTYFQNRLERRMATGDRQRRDRHA